MLDSTCVPFIAREQRVFLIKKARKFSSLCIQDSSNSPRFLKHDSILYAKRCHFIRHSNANTLADERGRQALLPSRRCRRKWNTLFALRAKNFRRGVRWRKGSAKNSSPFSAGAQAQMIRKIVDIPAVSCALFKCGCKRGDYCVSLPKTITEVDTNTQ